MLFVPALDRFTTMSRARVHGTSTIANIGVCVAGAAGYAVGGGALDLRVGAGLIVGATVGGVIGPRLLARASETVLRLLLIAILVLTAAKLAVDALRNAVTRRGDVAGCILHADRGSQFRSRAMARELRRHDMVGSMGRVGAAGDNAAMESFWSLLQTNVLNQQRWATRQELRLAIVVWIERKYHRQRAQDTLGGLTPIEFETKLAEPLTLAA